MPFLFLSGISFCQEFENFTRLESGGELPEDFTTSAEAKFNEDFANNTNDELDNSFFLESRFLIDKLLLGGRVLFNEPCSDYVNQVADYVLNSKPDLKSKLRFYVLKSNVPNAFSTDQGIIFITTALIASLENEAQMAFILAHEISHFTEKHVRNSYVDNQDVKKGTGEYQRSGLKARVEKLSQYSKNHELEADELGLELYLETEYDVEQIFETFGALLYSYLPYEDLTMDTTFLNTDLMHVPGVLFETELTQISRVEDYNDKNSTHPNIEKRMDAAFDILGDRKSKGSLTFKVSESEFNRVRSLVRLEQINLLLSNRLYDRALYSVYVMEKTLGESRFLSIAKVKALYGLAKYKNRNRFKEVIASEEENEGEISILHFFLNKISKIQLNVIAYRHAHDAFKRYGMPICRNYQNDLAHELAVVLKTKEEDYHPYTFAGYVDFVNADTAKIDILDSMRNIDNNTELSKYEKIKLKKEIHSFKGVDHPVFDPVKDFHLFAFPDKVADGSLEDEFMKARVDHETDFEVNTVFSEETMHEGANMGFDNVVIVDPSFEKYDLDKQKLFVDSEQSKIMLTKIYTKEYPNLELDRELLDSKILESNDIQKYSDIGIIYEWVMEVLEHNGADIITSTHDEMQRIIGTYGSEHYLFTGIHAFEKKVLFFRSNYTELTAFSINAKTDELEFVQYNHARIKPEGRRLDMYIFNILYQLNKEPEKY